MSRLPSAGILLVVGKAARGTRASAMRKRSAVWTALRAKTVPLNVRDAPVLAGGVPSTPVRTVSANACAKVRGRMIRICFKEKAPGVFEREIYEKRKLQIGGKEEEIEFVARAYVLTQQVAPPNGVWPSREPLNLTGYPGTRYAYTGCQRVAPGFGSIRIEIRAADQGGYVQCNVHTNGNDLFLPLRV